MNYLPRYQELKVPPLGHGPGESPRFSRDENSRIRAAEGRYEPPLGYGKGESPNFSETANFNIRTDRGGWEEPRLRVGLSESPRNYDWEWQQLYLQQLDDFNQRRADKGLPQIRPRALAPA